MSNTFFVFAEALSFGLLGLAGLLGLLVCGKAILWPLKSAEKNECERRKLLAEMARSDLVRDLVRQRDALMRERDDLLHERRSGLWSALKPASAPRDRPN